MKGELRFNLIESSPREQARLSDTTIEERFPIDVSKTPLPDIFDKKELSQDQRHELQRSLDTIFTEQRAIEMKGAAPKTSQGIPAVYYRHIPLPVFKEALKTGIHTPETYVQAETVSGDRLRRYLNDLYNEMTLESNKQEDLKKAFQDMSLGDQLATLFPEAPPINP